MKWSVVVFLIYLEQCLSFTSQLPFVQNKEDLDNLQFNTSEESTLKQSNKHLPNYLRFEADFDYCRQVNVYAIINGSINNVSVITQNCLNELVHRLFPNRFEKSFIQYLTTFIEAWDNKWVTSFHPKDSWQDCVNLQSISKCIHAPLISGHSKTYHTSCKNYKRVRDCIEREFHENCPNVPSYVVRDYSDIAKYSFCTDYKVSTSRNRWHRIIRRSIGGIGANRFPHIENAVKNECVRNGYLSSELNQTFDKMKECADKKRIFFTPRDEYISHIDVCSKSTRELLNKCLPEKFKYFPNFLFKLLDSIIRFLYDDMKELAVGLGPCLPALKRDPSKTKYEMCLATVEDGWGSDSLPPSKAEFCTKFLKAASCFTEQIEDTCEDNEINARLIRNYNKAMKDPCQ